MQTKISTALNIAAVAVAGAVLLPSCTKTAPAPATTVIVQAPAAAPAAKSEAAQDDIADLRDSDDINAPKSAAKTQSEPTDRDIEDPAPARKTSSKSASSSQSKSYLMDFYDRLPAKHFAMFQNGNRRALLNRKGAIVDYKHNFIEIPGSANERDGDLHKLQITLFPNGDEPWCAVSRIVWPRGQTPGAVDFYYGYSDDPDQHPRTAASGFFPYKLRRVDGAYESAWLPQRGLDIRINSAQDSELNGPIFRYSSKSRVGEPAFKEVYEDEEGNIING